MPGPSELARRQDWYNSIESGNTPASRRANVVDRPSIRDTDARRALILHDRPLVVDLIELTLNHGVFEVRAASDLATAERILTECQPHLAVVDMDHDDSTALMTRLGAANQLTRRATPALGLTRRGDLK